MDVKLIQDADIQKRYRDFFRKTYSSPEDEIIDLAMGSTGHRTTKW